MQCAKCCLFLFTLQIVFAGSYHDDCKCPELLANSSDNYIEIGMPKFFIFKSVSASFKKHLTLLYCTLSKNFLISINGFSACFLISLPIALSSVSFVLENK